MMRGPKPTPTIMVIRMKPLPRRRRIGHLRALILQQPARSIRREELVALVSDVGAVRRKNTRDVNRSMSPANCRAKGETNSFSFTT